MKVHAKDPQRLPECLPSMSIVRTVSESLETVKMDPPRAALSWQALFVRHLSTR